MAKKTKAMLEAEIATLEERIKILRDENKKYYAEAQTLSEEMLELRLQVAHLKEQNANITERLAGNYDSMCYTITNYITGKKVKRMYGYLVVD